jgi:hypothetical protein
MSAEIRERMERELAGIGEVVAESAAGPAVLQDAEHLAVFCRGHMQAVEEGPGARPGLLAVGLSPDLPEEMFVLIVMVREANVASHRKASGQPHDRIAKVLRELRAELRWLAVNTPALAAQVNGLRKAHRAARRPGDMMMAIADHLVLAREHEARLRALGAWRAPVVEEADALLAAWREALAAARDPQQVRRQGLAAMLRKRMRLALEAVDFAYREHPAIAAEARSERMRRHAAAAARARRRHGDAKAEPAVTPEDDAAPSTPA